MRARLHVSASAFDYLLKKHVFLDTHTHAGDTLPNWAAYPLSPGNPASPAREYTSFPTNPENGAYSNLLFRKRSLVNLDQNTRCSSYPGRWEICSMQASAPPRLRITTPYLNPRHAIHRPRYLITCLFPPHLNRTLMYLSASPSDLSFLVDW